MCIEYDEKQSQPIHSIAKTVLDDENEGPEYNRTVSYTHLNYNPLKPASVKVSLSGKPVGMGITAWAKVAMPSAADGSGIYSLPNVGDEVVSFFGR